jgi:hypothetical protein
MTKKNTRRTKTVSQQTSFTLKDKTAKAKSRRKLQRRAKSMARDAQGRFVASSFTKFVQSAMQYARPNASWEKTLAGRYGALR